MLPFQTLVTIDKTAAMPVYRQIANGLVHLIRTGLVRPGTMLPPSREMAALLKVHRKTIVAAYEELFVQDWIETIPRKGVMVSNILPEIKPRSFKAGNLEPGYARIAGFKFQQLDTHIYHTPAPVGQRLVWNDGFPDARIAPVDQLLKGYRDCFQRSLLERFVVYGDQAGSFNLRKEIAGFLGETRGLHVDVPHVLTTRGAQMAIFIAARIILKPGSTVVVGEPNYAIANNVFRQFGAKLIKVPVDANGIDVKAIGKICKQEKPDLLSLIPHHQHPPTVTLSAERRMLLLQLIRKYKFPVIEDDYDYDSHYGRSFLLDLAMGDHGGRVTHIGSLTKTLASYIRSG